MITILAARSSTVPPLSRITLSLLVCLPLRPPRARTPESFVALYAAYGKRRTGAYGRSLPAFAPGASGWIRGLCERRSAARTGWKAPWARSVEQRGITSSWLLY